MPKLASVRLFAAIVLLSAVTSAVAVAGLMWPAAASPDSTLAQGSPTSASVADAAGYSGQLTVTNASGTVTYTENSSADSADVVVDSTGAITAASSLTPATYTVSGADSDTNGDTGTWSFALTVNPAVVPLAQGSPTSASVADAAGYSGQLTVTNASGTVTYTENSSADSADVVVDSTGAITAASSLTPATYTVSGADSDTNGDTGTWSFALTVNPAVVPLAQGSPTSASVADAAGYSGQLTVTNASGTVTYTENSSADSADVVVDSTGAITAASSLTPATYTVSGADSDTNGDTGTWSFALTVNPAVVPLAQGSPTSASVADAAGYSGQLTVTNASGTVTYTENSSADSADVVVDSTGAITAASSLTPATYTVSGADSDTNGDTGTWSFALTVNPAVVPLAQGSPTSASVADAAGYSGQLTVTNASGTVTYTENSSADSADVVVDSTGAITAASSLTPATYTVSGADSDTNGDTGTWSFALTVNPAVVPLAQGSPTSASVADAAGYSGQLTVTNASGTVTYTENSSADSADVVVDSTGAITAASSLTPATYTVSGADSDTNGDTGTWSFALTVNPAVVPLAQGSPTSASVADAAGYSGQLTVTNASGTVTYTENSSADSADVVVDSTGAITAASSLTPATYTVSGADSDTNGDTGTWSFALTVNPAVVPLAQGSPTSASVADAAGYSGQLTVTNASGTVTYTENSSADSADVVVDSTGAITAASSLTPATYTVSGADSDTNGDTGTWSFALTVNPAVVPLAQGSPTSASVADAAGYSGQLTVTNASGTVTYTENSSADSADVVVDSTGAITAASSLTPATYTVSGADSDTNGDTGTWSFALTVNPAVVPPPPSGGSPPSSSSPPSPPVGATSSQNCSSSSSSATCSATNDATTVSGTGVGAVTVSEYASDPVASPSFSTPGGYFDVEVAAGSSFSSLTITDCNLNGATSLEWWNGGAWEPVTPTSYTAGPPACVSATISSTSSPSLSQLTGTVFAAAALATVPGAPTKVSATAGNSSATLTWTAPSSDGGAAVTGYVIKASHGPVVKVADVANDIITGLNNGTVYSFTVAAINAIGTGPSSTSNSVTPAKPTSVTVLKLSLKRVTYGDEQTEHISFSVSPQHSGSMPTGTVTVKASATTLCVIKLKSAKGSCSLSSKELKSGTYHLVATYGGSLEFVGSFARETLTVVTLTVVTGTLTVVPSTVVRGGTVTVTGKGFSAGAAVSINVCNIEKVTTAAFNEALPGHINVSFKMPDGAPLGACKFNATGLGTSNQTLVLTTTVIVKSATKTVLKLSAAKVTYGDERVEQMSVTVSPEFTAPAPTGKVTISDGKTTLCVLALLSDKGSCSLSSKELKPGTYHLVATYGGSSEFTGSFATETLTVVK